MATYKFCTHSQLRNKHRGLPLPFLIVLPVPIPLFILALTHRHPTNLEQQEAHKSRTNTAQPRRHHLAQQPPTRQPHAHLSRSTHQDSSRQGRDAGPQCRLAKVIRMPALTPQSPGQKVLLVLLLLLLLHPRVLLPVGDHFEGQAAHVEQDTDEVGDADSGGQGGEEGDGEGIDGQNGHEAEGDPGCLGEEGAEEFGRGLSDVVEAGVGPVGADSAEQVGSHYDYEELVLA